MKAKKAVFFVRRAALDLVAPHRFGVPAAYRPQQVSPGSTEPFPYQLDYTTEGMAEYYGMRFDDAGIIMMAHYIDHEDGSGHYYSPVKIAHYALGAWNDFLQTRSSECRSAFRRHTDWIRDHSVKEEIGRVWRVPSSNPKYELENGYISAISQGLVLSVLARAYIDQANDEVKATGEEALEPLRVPVEHGGLLGNGRWGPCFEEYPCVPYSHVLNGFDF